MRKFKFSYDKDSDNLFLYYPKSKSKGSVELGDFVFDYNNKKEFVGLQIANASKMIKEMSNEKLLNIKNILNNLTECKIESIFQRNVFIVKILLRSNTEEIMPMLSIPSVSPSPALAY